MSHLQLPDKCIQIRSLKKTFGSKIVLSGVDLDVYRGESIAVIGASGTGKSVLIKHIIGLLKPDSGTIMVDDVNVASLTPLERGVFVRRFGMLFQGGALFDSMSVYQNIAFPMVERASYSKEQINKKVMELLALVEMDGWENMYPADLSGGMKKRIGLARALATEPSIMLYDEPTTGLDPVVGGVIDKLIVRTRDKYHVTSIAITHDMKSAYRIAHRIAMLYKGKVIFVGTPEEIQKCEIPEVKNFVTDRVSTILAQ